MLERSVTNAETDETLNGVRFPGTGPSQLRAPLSRTLSKKPLLETISSFEEGLTLSSG